MEFHVEKTTVIVTVSEKEAKTVKILQTTVKTVIVTVLRHLVFHRIGNRIGNTD